MRRIYWGIFLLVSLPAFAQDPLSLPEAVQMALQGHPSVEATEAKVNAAATKIKQANSGYMPRLNYQESVTRGNNPVYVFGSLLTQRQFGMENFAIDKLNKPDFLNNFQSQLILDQTIFDAGQTKNRKRSAKLGKAMAEEQLRATRMRVIANVIRAYYGSVVAEESLKVAEEALKSALADQRRAEASRAAGMATDADVLSIQVHVASVKEQKIERASQLAVARAALNEALGLPLDTPHKLTTELKALVLPKADLSRYEEQAVKQRPELHQAQFAATLAETQSKLARAGYWPQISFRGVFEADRQQFANKGGANWFFGATMRWNLFNGMATREQVRGATFALRSALAQEKQADAGIRLQVRQAHAELRAAQERIGVATAAVAQAEESLRITKNRYEAGLTTVTDLLRTETALLQARTRRLAAVYDQRVAAAKLELATGVLSTDSEVLK